MLFLAPTNSVKALKAISTEGNNNSYNNKTKKTTLKTNLGTKSLVPIEDICHTVGDEGVFDAWLTGASASMTSGPAG